MLRVVGRIHSTGGLNKVKVMSENLLISMERQVSRAPCVNNAVTTSRRYFFDNPYSHSGPSPTTSVLLRNLPPAVTEKKLIDAVDAAAITGCKKVILEPGCSLHFLQEHEARNVASLIEQEFACQTHVSNATVPCITLRNLPENISVEALQEHFAEFDPIDVALSGQLVAQIGITGAKAALDAANALSALTFQGQQLKLSSVHLMNDQFLLTAYNISASVSRDDVEAAVAQALKDVAVESSDLKFLPLKDTILTARLANASKSEGISSVGTSLDIASTDLDQVQTALEQALEGSKEHISIMLKHDIAKPALFVRNLEFVKDQEKTFPKLLESAADLERVQYLRKYNDRPIDMAILYFAHHDAAYACFADLHGTIVDGKRLSVTYRDATEPAICIKNLPKHADAEALSKLFPPSIDIVRIVMKDNCEAIVVLESPHDVRLAELALTNKTFDDCSLQVTPVDIGDIGIEVRSSGEGALSVSDLKERIAECIASQGLSSKGFSVSSNSNAFISFKNLQQAIDARTYALERHARGDGILNSANTGTNRGSSVFASVSVAPSHVLEVSNLPNDTSVQQLVDTLGITEGKQKIIQSDRSALVKFRRHKDVVPGMKALKMMQWEGERADAEVATAPMKVIRYRPLQLEGYSEYDQLDFGNRVKHPRQTSPLLASFVDSRIDKYDDLNDARHRAKDSVEFDHITTKNMLQDYMDSDPALRYKIAKNSFERALFDAKATGNLDLLIGPEISKEVQAEVRELVSGNASRTADKSQEEINHRLFEIFMQKKDMERFTNDLKDFEALFGPVDENDGFNWSQFELESDKDIVRLKEQLARTEELALEQMVANVRNRKIKFGDLEDGDEDLIGEGSDGTVKSNKTSVNVIVKGDTPDSDTVVKVSPPSQTGNVLRDRDGFLWSACIIDTDMVQKTMPGNRVNTHRALVVVGNLKGSAGFGMGKGKTGSDAVNAACRAALRNLTHIDLYDNFGLAHDLHGKHNSCNVYIRATPNSRRMVASPLATEILNRFGISSASVKIKGRRNPYSQVRAIFNALANHQNIDEFAKERGKRYLTIRWAYENNL